MGVLTLIEYNILLSGSHIVIKIKCDIIFRLDRLFFLKTPSRLDRAEGLTGAVALEIFAWN